MIMLHNIEQCWVLEGSPLLQSPTHALNDDHVLEGSSQGSCLACIMKGAHCCHTSPMREAKPSDWQA